MEPAWNTSSKAVALGLVQGVPATDIFLHALATEMRGLWYYDPVRPLKEVEDLSIQPSSVWEACLVLLQGNGFNHEAVSTYVR